MTATKRKPRPITANPLFPLVTALWAATFLGLGSFAVAPALLEGPVVALGIPALVPAATPPLGFTARVMFAIAMMGMGAVVGYAIGRLMGRQKIEAPVRMRGFGKPVQEATTFETCRPINASEDLGAPLDAPVAEEAPLRRRALNLDAPLDAPADHAPLDGTMPWDREPAEKSTPDFGPDFSDTLPDSALDAGNVDPLALDLLLEEASAVDHAPFAATRTILADPVTFEEQAAQPAAEAAAIDGPSFAPPAFVPAPSPIPQASTLQAPILQAQAATATPIDRAPLESLGLVQLTGRLALAIARRTEAAERPATREFTITAPAPQPPAIARFESAALAQPEEEAGEAVRVSGTEPPERVVQLRPSTAPSAQPFADPVSGLEADDADEGEDLGLDRFLRMSPLLARKRPSTIDGDEPHDSATGAKHDDDDCVADAETTESEDIEDRYPSLLDMGPVVARREPLRVSEDAMEHADGATANADGDRGMEPVVIFPGQESPLITGPSASDAASSGTARPFERPSIMPLPGSPLASRGRAAPSPQTLADDEGDAAVNHAVQPDAEEADRALRAALATLQRMTAQG